jgi:hypothetical protein
LLLEIVISYACPILPSFATFSCKSSSLISKVPGHLQIFG